MANTRASSKRKLEGTKKVTKRQRPSAIGAPKRLSRIKRERNAAQTSIVPGERFPPWQSLPFDVLLCIFKNASYPLLSDEMAVTPTASWLINTSKVCKAFCEPALSALYETPPLIHHYHFRQLDRLLHSKSTTSIDYKKKIRQLNFNIESMRYGEIKGAVELLIPLLAGLKGQARIISDPEFGWVDALATGRIGLTRLRLGGYQFFPHGLSFHNLLIRTELRNLKDLTLSYMDFVSQTEVALNNTLLKLPSLERLEFRKCLLSDDIHDEASEEASILYHLPPGITELAFVQCSGLDSERLMKCLQISGRHLRRFESSHNHALDLRFIRDLATLCPELTHIKYDLTLFSPLVASTHHDPDFHELLQANDIPEWPSTLQEINMTQLRHWDSKAAESFFKSLLDSADQLRSLSKLCVTASIDAGWRERASFRENIIGPIYNCFKKRRIDPDPNLRTLRPAKLNDSKANDKYASTPQAPKTRKSNRLLKASGGDNHESRSELQQKSFRHAAAKGSGNEYDNHTVASFVQGNCNSVHIRVDNLRPSEDQMNEDDFLDSERSGDEAWDPAKGDPDDD